MNRLCNIAITNLASVSTYGFIKFNVPYPWTYKIFSTYTTVCSSTKRPKKGKKRRRRLVSEIRHLCFLNITNEKVFYFIDGQSDTLALLFLIYMLVISWEGKTNIFYRFTWHRITVKLYILNLISFYFVNFDGLHAEQKKKHIPPLFLLFVLLFLKLCKTGWFSVLIEMYNRRHDNG